MWVGRYSEEVSEVERWLEKRIEKKDESVTSSLEKKGMKMRDILNVPAG